MMTFDLILEICIEEFFSRLNFFVIETRCFSYLRYVITFENIMSKHHFSIHQIVPRNLLFAHGAEVISIACAPDGNLEHPNIVSLASNGYGVFQSFLVFNVTQVIFLKEACLLKQFLTNYLQEHAKIFYFRLFYCNNLMSSLTHTEGFKKFHHAKNVFFRLLYRELCVWDIEDGLCLTINQIPGKHTSITVNTYKAS